ncbi:MAG: ATP-binding protein, partial [Armatimonadetes bacterium]|nr:ATP-binding protein [Armatimonadota bacterium]
MAAAEDLRYAIEEFLRKQEGVYEADPDRITRDARAARSVSRDYAGRWFFELLQNAYDAGAKTVKVVVTSEAIYVADDGRGFSPSAVKSISGTHLSEKPGASIGRKGLGFKSVYELTTSPHVYTGRDAGLKFDIEEAREWLMQRGFPVCDDVPYQWLPFFVSRATAEREDKTLASLSEFSTVIKLPLDVPDAHDKAVGCLFEFPATTLLTLGSLRRVQREKIETPDERFAVSVEIETTGEHFAISVEPLGRKRSSELMALTDSRKGTTTVWRVMATPFRTPKSILASTPLSREEKQRVESVWVLVAAPVDYNAEAQPLLDPWPYLHVFYPTEQVSPVPLLLHADFLVKSDRTQVLALDRYEFNDWLADRLAETVVSFVNACRDSRKPWSHILLLNPHEALEEHQLAEQIWKKICTRARKALLLPDRGGNFSLNVCDAIVLKTTRPDLARRLLRLSDEASHLVHAKIDEYDDAAKVLIHFGCSKFSDQDVVAFISKRARAEQRPGFSWVWDCWLWTAQYLAQGPDSDERKRTVCSLPLIPIGGQLYSRAELGDDIVAWSHARDSNIPDWLPLKYIDESFARRLERVDSPEVRSLMKVLRVTEPTPDTQVEALRQAIDAYWRKKDGDPLRFVSFLLDLVSNSHDRNEVDVSKLCRCPIPVRTGINGEHEIAPACEAYFGEEWEEKLLPTVYASVQDIKWALPIASYSKRQQREVFDALGVMSCPRVIARKDSEGLDAETERLKSCLRAKRASWTRFSEPEAYHVLEHVSLPDLTATQTMALLTMIATNWATYYKRHSQVQAQYFYYRPQRDDCDSLWWYQLQQQTFPPLVHRENRDVPLTKCWSPKGDAAREIGELIPVIDLSGVPDEHRQTVAEWLEGVCKLRKSLSQLRPEDWRDLLNNVVPAVVPPDAVSETPSLADKVRRWYEACLSALNEKDASWASPEKGCLSGVALLCRRGQAWSYVGGDQPRFIADDERIRSAFEDAVWSFHVRSNLRSAAARYFNLPLLSESTTQELIPCEIDNDATERLQRDLEAVLPFVFALRCSETQQDPVKLREQLRRLHVRGVTQLRARVSIECDLIELVPREIELSHVVQGDDLLVRASDPANEIPALAAALAERLEVPTNADLYENLLRCRNEGDRRA